MKRRDAMNKMEKKLALSPDFIKEINGRRKEWGRTVSLEELKSALGR
jgi:hypothetical protein